jgi:hypothetical protein
VHHLRTNHIRYLFAGLLLLGATDSTAKADPITPSYTVTDLGSGNATLSTSAGGSIPVNLTAPFDGSFASVVSSAANGAQITSVSDGQATYPFAFAPSTVLTSYQGIMTNFPLAVAPPVNGPGSYGDPAFAYSTVFSPSMNANGIVVAIDSAGVYGHQGESSVYYVQRNADGSWGLPNVVWTGTTQFGQGPNIGGVVIAGINNLNQIVGLNYNPNYPSLYNAVLYDIGTHTLTNLSALPGLAGYTNIVPIAIDDQGRILVEASPVPGSGVQSEQTLLLTPAGGPGNEVGVPEPSSLAVMVLAMGAFAVRRLRDRIRRSDGER